MGGPVKPRAWQSIRILALIIALVIAVLVALAWLAPSASRAATADRALQLNDGALGYIPASLPVARPAPLLVLLHGASGQPANIIRHFLDEAERHGIILVAPAARKATWDAIDEDRRPQAGWSTFTPKVRSTMKTDPPRIRAAMAAIEQQAPVDHSRVALAGFSDGASYVLAFGLTEPKTFGTLIAFSPGIVPGGRGRTGQRIFVAHGRQDRVLSFDTTASKIVPKLRLGRTEIVFRRFDGGHEMPDAVQEEAVAFFLARTQQPRIGEAISTADPQFRSHIFFETAWEPWLQSTIELIVRCGGGRPPRWTAWRHAPRAPSGALAVWGTNDGDHHPRRGRFRHRHDPFLHPRARRL
jgi:phospholipase/carboxylesterase